MDTIIIAAILVLIVIMVIVTILITSKPKRKILTEEEFDSIFNEIQEPITLMVGQEEERLPKKLYKKSSNKIEETLERVEDKRDKQQPTE